MLRLRNNLMCGAAALAILSTPVMAQQDPQTTNFPDSYGAAADMNLSDAAGTPVHSRDEARLGEVDHFALRGSDFVMVVTDAEGRDIALPMDRVAYEDGAFVAEIGAEEMQSMQPVAEGETRRFSDEATLRQAWQEADRRRAEAGDAADTTRIDAGGGQLVVEQAEPRVTVDVEEPRVTVDQSAPQVRIEQPQPTVTVTQANPTVTVDIPEPVVTITMPEPDVDVATSEPQVSVEQPEPQVRFVRPEPKVEIRQAEPRIEVSSGEAQVDVSSEPGDANVEISQAEPKVQVNSAGEPSIEVNQAEPEVRVREADQASADARQPADPEAADRDAAASPATVGDEDRAAMNDAETHPEQDEAANADTTQLQDTELQEERVVADSGMQDEAVRNDEMAAAETTAGVTTPLQDTELQEEEVAAADTAAQTDPAMPEARTMQARDGYRILDRNALTADDITGTDVYDSNDKWVGEVGELIVEENGEITYAVIDVGGFLGLGEKPVAVTMSELSIQQIENGADIRIFTDLTESDLNEMPRYR